MSEQESNSERHFDFEQWFNDEIERLKDDPEYQEIGEKLEQDLAQARANETSEEQASRFSVDALVMLRGKL